MRLIDADDLHVDYLVPSTTTMTKCYEYVSKAQINNAPTIEDVPERKKGRWERYYLRSNVYADLFWHCSVCGYKAANNYANIYYKFCPHCGASMTKGSEEK